MTSFPLRGVTQGALLETLAREAAGRRALEYPALGLSWTYGGLDARSRALARGLVAIGVERGDRVAVWAVNVPDWTPLQFAIARIGAVLVTANPQLAPPEIGYLLRQSRASVLVASGESLARAEVPGEVTHLIALDAPASGPADPRTIGVDELVRRGADVSDAEVDARCAATSVEEPANIQYTSGTTGFPKGVVLTHRNVVENAFTMARLLDVRPDDRLLLMVPLFHCFGCVIVVLGAFTHAATIAAFERFSPETVLRAWTPDAGFDLLYGVPTMFRMLLDHPEFTAPSADPRRPARAGLMAGAPCPEALMRSVVTRMRCAGMIVAYGLTEASPACTASRPDDPIEVRCGTAGRAIEGVEVRVVDPQTGRDRPAGETGEVRVRGPNVMRGYFDMPEATAETFDAHGRLRTGDLGTLDGAGLLRIVGRLKELIKRGGESVFPAEVEDVLRRHPAIADAAVFGVPSSTYGEEVAAAIVLRSKATLDAEELEAFLEPRLARCKRPTRVAFLAALPLTGSGKVRKFKLPEMCGFA